jgi:hypothetical protein
MNVFRFSARFRGSEDGAVTVDWVVLTAAVIGIGVAALAAIRTSTGSLTSRINSQITAQGVFSTF